MKVLFILLPALFIAVLSNAQAGSPLETYKKTIIGKWISNNNKKESFTFSKTNITERYSSGKSNVYPYWLEYDAKNKAVILYEDMIVEQPFEYRIKIDKNMLYMFLIGGNGKIQTYNKAK